MNRAQSLDSAHAGGLFSSAAAFGQSAGGSNLFGAPTQSAPATNTLFGTSQPASGGLFGQPQSAASAGQLYANGPWFEPTQECSAASLADYCCSAAGLAIALHLHVRRPSLAFNYTSCDTC